MDNDWKGSRRKRLPSVPVPHSFDLLNAAAHSYTIYQTMHYPTAKFEVFVEVQWL